MMFTQEIPEEEFFWWYRAEFVRIYDGDTIWIKLDMGRGHWDCGLDGEGFAIRLWGIDTPELRGAEREAGIRAREFARAWLPPPGGEIRLRSVKDTSGKYGRYLAEVYVPHPDGGWLNLNKMLLDHGHATVPGYL